MSFFDFAAMALGAAARTASQGQQQPRGVTGGSAGADSCTPCAANAYAEQSAEMVRQMLGDASSRSKKAKTRRRSG